MPPPKKKEKKEKVAKLPVDDSNSGVIRFEIDEPDNLEKEGEYSHEVVVGGMPWRARICLNEFQEIDWEAENDWEDDRKYTIYLHNMYKQLTPWLIEATVEYTIVTDKGWEKDEPRSCIFSHEYDNENVIGTIDEYEKSEQCTEEKLIVEIRFTITSKKGFRTPAPIDFTDPNEPRHDVALVIGGEKIYASKQILAFHSPVFNAMFYGSYDEKDKKEIELKDINREEFIELLQVIYPSDKKITEDSAECILKLADRYQIEYAMERAEAVLVNSSFVFDQEKLRIGDKYRLFGLKYHVFSGFERKEDCMKVMDWPIYSNLSDDTKKELSEKIADMTY